MRSLSPSQVAAQSRERRRLTELESRVATMTQEVAKLKQQHASLTPQPVGDNDPDTDPVIRDVILVTETIFNGPIVVETEFDPCDPATSWVVFNVGCEGSIESLRAKEMEWNQKISTLKPGNSEQLRLVVLPIE